MKELAIFLVMLLIFVLGGCVTTQTKQTVQILDSAVETLAKDWPKASGAIRGGLDEDYLPKNILDKLNEIDSWWKDKNDNWIPSDEITFNEYQTWYIAVVRLSHTGPILQAIIRQYAPGLLNLSQVVSGLTFLGLGGL